MKSTLSTLLLILLFSTSVSAQDRAFCSATAHKAQRACLTTAHSDNVLALAKCGNIANSAERTACTQEAFADFRAASELCDAEHAVRQAACKRLGEDRYDPEIDPRNFIDTIDNPYFPLKPGTSFIYEGVSGGSKIRVVFAVTSNVVPILGVNTVEVHDSVFTDGELTEDTLDWFAQDRQGNVWYFGENTEELINGRPSTLDGTFTAGVNHDKPGIVMEAHSLVGDFYRQEFSLDNAEDFAEVKSLKDSVTVPFGTFHHCLRTHESTPLEPDLSEDKVYAPGIGNVLSKDLVTGDVIKLVAIETDPVPSAHAANSAVSQQPASQQIVKRLASMARRQLRPF